jgi:hypothetical protein
MNESSLVSSYVRHHLRNHDRLLRFVTLSSKRNGCERTSWLWSFFPDNECLQSHLTFSEGMPEIKGISCPRKMTIVTHTQCEVVRAEIQCAEADIISIHNWPQKRGKGLSLLSSFNSPWKSLHVRLSLRSHMTFTTLVTITRHLILLSLTSVFTTQVYLLFLFSECYGKPVT